MPPWLPGPLPDCAVDVEVDSLLELLGSLLEEGMVEQA